MAPQARENDVYHPIVQEWIESQGYTNIWHEPRLVTGYPDFIAWEGNTLLIFEAKWKLVKLHDVEAVCTQLRRYRNELDSSNFTRDYVGVRLVAVADFAHPEAFVECHRQNIELEMVPYPYWIQDRRLDKTLFQEAILRRMEWSRQKFGKSEMETNSKTIEDYRRDLEREKMRRSDGAIFNRLAELVNKTYGYIPSQVKLAQDIGVSQGTISNWLLNRVGRIDAEPTERICKFLGVSIDDLLYIDWELVR